MKVMRDQVFSHDGSDSSMIDASTLHLIKAVTKIHSVQEIWVGYRPNAQNLHLLISQGSSIIQPPKVQGASTDRKGSTL